jgi:hypothetical protein
VGDENKKMQNVGEYKCISCKSRTGGGGCYKYTLYGSSKEAVRSLVATVILCKFKHLNYLSKADKLNKSIKIVAVMQKYIEMVAGYECTLGNIVLLTTLHRKMSYSYQLLI